MLRQFRQLSNSYHCSAYVPLENLNQISRTEKCHVVNKSDRKLTDSELSVLQKGLNFCVTPTKIPTAEFVTGIETACNFIGANSETSLQLRSDCVRILKDVKPPKSNITREESVALRDLRSDDSILVLPADKGRATVILNKDSYIDKAKDLLSDSNTYKRLTKDPTPSYRNQIISVLQSLRDSGAIDVPTYRRLYPTSSDVPKFYGLPKIHKSTCPLRPIVSSCGSITYNSAKFLADILSPLVGRSSRHLKNSADLVNKLSDIRINQDECLVSYDVSALFTSVPVDESINIIRDLLINDESLEDRCNLSPEQVTDLLSVCLKTTYFIHNGTFYSQREGAAMGSPVSPIIANLFMEHFENRAISSFATPLKFYARYVDDTMVILKRSAVDNFTEHLNSIHPAIKFTVEHEENNQIAMLDTLITRNGDGELSFSVYRKPTHTDQYLHFNSHQPLQHKLGVIRTLKHRAKTISSDNNTLDNELKHIKQALSVCGYAQWVWNSSASNKITTKPRHHDKAPVGSISIPYVQGATECLSRRIRKAGVSVHVKPTNTIRSMLVAPKDKIKKGDRSCVVYGLECNDCDSMYVGETERPLRKRLTEHQRDSSPFGAHLKSEGHKFTPQDAKILDSDSRWLQRGIKESFYIAALQPDLNQDKGRHTLSPVYDAVIKSCDLGSRRGSHD